MTSIERLTTLVGDIKPLLKPTCQWLCALTVVLQEQPETPTTAALRKQVEKMLAQCRALCCEYDNLRSLTGRLEKEQRVEDPKFWEGEINLTCEPGKCRQRKIIECSKEEP